MSVIVEEMLLLYDKQSAAKRIDIIQIMLGVCVKTDGQLVRNLIRTKRPPSATNSTS
ncbi:hypothetical protein MHI37_03335 [Paenibacillus sp. FSL H8-0548]|uniref:hypothetical protein n=1 Tax=Paenibacillus sp. FSL H8-0548 TaxID=1920422 RepID=UPI00315B0A40